MRLLYPKNIGPSNRIEKVRFRFGFGRIEKVRFRFGFGFGIGFGLGFGFRIGFGLGFEFGIGFGFGLGFGLGFLFIIAAFTIERVCPIPICPFLILFFIASLCRNLL